jgi:Type II CAAX prenyl endopeptidase Rce1-like
LIFRIKLHWWSSLLATSVMLLAAWSLGGLGRLWGPSGSMTQSIGLGVAAGITCGLINLLTHRILLCSKPGSYARQFEKFAIDVIGRMRPIDAVAGGIMAGLGEEPLFRGVLVPACGPPVVGVIVAAIVFGLAHYLRREYLGFLVWGMCEGVLFGTLFVLTDSIVVPAVAHGLFDTVGFLYFERLRDQLRIANCKMKIAK